MKGFRDSQRINSKVREKTDIFTGNQGLHQVWWELFVGNDYSPLDKKLLNLVSFTVIKNRR